MRRHHVHRPALGTERVMRTRVYGQLTRTEAVAFDGDLVALGRTYLDIATQGTCTDEQRMTLFDAGRSMIEPQGAEAKEGEEKR